MNTVAYFDQDLQRSLDTSKDAGWIEFYRSYWPNAVSIIGIGSNSQWQKWGIDRLVLLPNGKQLTVDEKIRAGTYDDFLAEEKHVYKDGAVKPGWTVDRDKRCDFIAYAVPELGQCTLLPFEILRLTAQKNLCDWKSFPPNPLKPAPNKRDRRSDLIDWNTHNVAVTWDRLFADMNQIMRQLQASGSSLKLTGEAHLAGQSMFGFWKV